MNISFLMPSHTPVDPRVLHSALALGMDAARNNVFLQPEVEYERSSVQASREHLAELFLDSGNMWAFWMDSDMVLEAHTIRTLLRCTAETGAAMATGVYYGRAGYELCRRATDAILRGAKAAEEVKEFADQTIVERKTRPVLRPDVIQSDEPFKVEAAGFGCMLVHRRVFESMKRPFFDFKGEDFGFCEVARSFGHTIFAVPSLKCGHLGTAPVMYGKE